MGQIHGQPKNLTCGNFTSYKRYFPVLNFCLCLPLQPCVVADCGEHKDGDSWGVAPSDGSGDTHPDFPEDSDVDFKDVSVIALWAFVKGPLWLFWKCARLSNYSKSDEINNNFNIKIQAVFSQHGSRVKQLLNNFKGLPPKWGMMDYYQYFECTHFDWTLK